MKLILLALLVTLSALGVQTSVASQPSGAASATAGQVLIEAVIIQIPASGSNTLGMSYRGREAQGLDNYSLGTGMLSSSNLFFVTHLMPMAETHIAGTQETKSDHLAKPAKDAKSASMTTKPKASQPGGFTYLAKVGNDLDALVPALADDSRVRILQRPRIQTSQGERATIFVGEARPYPTNYYYGGGAYSSVSAMELLQIGVTLEVIPLVRPDGFVEMDIHQKIDSFAGNVMIENVGEVPITSSREMQAKVVVRDRETILLGGWTETDKTGTPSDVPPPKNTQALGAPFRGSSAYTTRNEVIVLIRPTVLPTPETPALKATAEKK